MDYKSINLVWLSKTDLANMNAGEGSSNIVEIKTYSNNQKPYISGQAVRHALREAISRENPKSFKCTPEAPCCDIENCWLCDMFGFLNPMKGSGSDRRWSPIKMTPALGQISNEIVTDMLTRMSDLLKEGGETNSKKKDQRIAYIQLMENVYKTGFSLDIANLGKTVKPNIKDRVIQSFEEEKYYEDDEKKERIKAVINGVWNLSDFAKQARNMASLSPEIVVASMQKVYNHNIQKAIQLDDEGNINCSRFKTTIDDAKQEGNEIFVGYVSGVLQNEEKFLETLEEMDDIDLISPASVKENIINKF